MSCGCNEPYNNVCRQDIPYPQISHESVPSLIDNLVQALYGDITKSVVANRVVWNIPCDPASNPAEVPGLPRMEGEGLLCYIMRVFVFVLAQSSFNQNSNYQVTGTPTARNLVTRGADIINVKDFGATGNGTTDDTAAIQAAITAAPAGAAIYFPRGSYKAYLVQVTKDITIFGDGMDVTELVFGQEYGAATNVGTYFKQTSYFNLNGGVEFYLRNLTMVDKFGFRATGKFLLQTGYPIQPMGICGNNRDSRVATDFANLIDVQNVKFLDLYIPIETNAKKLVCINNQFLWTYGKASVGMPIYQAGNGPLPGGGTGKYFGDPHAAIIGGFGTCLIKNNYYNGLMDYSFANANTGYEDYRIAGENFLDLRGGEQWLIDAWQTNESGQQEVINNTVLNHGIEGFIWNNSGLPAPIITGDVSINCSNNFFRPVQKYFVSYYQGTTPCIAFRNSIPNTKICNNKFENTFSAITVIRDFDTPGLTYPYSGNIEISNNTISGSLNGITVSGLQEKDIISNNTIQCDSEIIASILSNLYSLGIYNNNTCESNITGIFVSNCNPLITNNNCSAKYSFQLETTLVSQLSNVLTLANTSGIVAVTDFILIKYQNKLRWLPVENVTGNNITVNSAFLAGIVFPTGIEVYHSRFLSSITGAICIVNQSSIALNVNQAFYNTTINGFLSDNSAVDINGTGNSSTMINTTAIDVYQKTAEIFAVGGFWKTEGYYIRK